MTVPSLSIHVAEAAFRNGHIGKSEDFVTDVIVSTGTIYHCMILMVSVTDYTAHVLCSRMFYTMYGLVARHTDHVDTRVYSRTVIKSLCVG